MSEPKPMPLTAEENRDEVRDAVARVNRAIKESDAHICVDGLIRPYMQLVCSSRCHHEKPTEFRQLQEEKAGLSLALDAERAARAAAERERDEALKAFTLGVVERDELRGVVQRREQATENLIRSAIIAADFIEGEYADGNDDGDIIPVSSPAYKIHERLWGAIFKADLPDGAVVLAARTNGAAQ